MTERRNIPARGNRKNTPHGENRKNTPREKNRSIISRWKNRAVKNLTALLLALLLLIPAAAFAEESGSLAAQSPPNTENDSGIIDAEMLNEWMDGFVREHSMDGNWQDVSIGFCYTGTGDCWFYNPDIWMYSASLYKVPVSMLMAEKEAAGELTPESIVLGTTLEYLESTALVYSNNDSGHAMVTWLGGTYNGKCSDMTEKFTDLPEDYFSQDFLDVSYYTARYMTQVLKTLYEGGDETFPHVIDYLLQAQPNEYFNIDSTLKSYGVAQKYGAFEETHISRDNNHCAAIIYTPTPIIVTVMTRNVGEYQKRIAEVGAYLADYSLQLDEKRAEEPPAPEPASPEPEVPAEAESPAPEAEIPDEPMPTAETTAAETIPVEEGARKIPAAGIVVGIAAVAALGAAGFLLSRKHQKERTERTAEKGSRKEKSGRYSPRH